MKPIYHIISISELDEYQNCKIGINWDSPLFDGHFPDYPILPGAMVLNIVHALMESIFQKDLRFEGSDKLKFLSPVVPETAGDLLFRIECLESNGIRAEVIASDGAGVVVFKGVLRYR